MLLLLLHFIPEAVFCIPEPSFTSQELVAAYRASCIANGVKPIGKLAQQIQVSNLIYQGQDLFVRFRFLDFS